MCLFLRHAHALGRSPSLDSTKLGKLFVLQRGILPCRLPRMQFVVVSSNTRLNACQGQASREDTHIVPNVASLVIASSLIAACDPAWASVEASYSPEQGSETLKNVAGIGYIILVIFYFFRLLKKRAEKAASEPLSSSSQSTGGTDAEDDGLSRLDRGNGQGEASQQQDDVTVIQCLIGVAQAGTICFLFYLLSRVVDDYFAHQDLPSQYTAQNITLLIQSVVRGLVYLVTFIFGANATGLAALSIQLVIDPEGVDRGLDQPKPKKEALPKVKVTDDMGSIKRAFKEAERMGKENTNK